MIRTVFLFISSVFAFIGALGAVRFPDFYTRVHALTMVTVGGVVLGLVGYAAGETIDVYFTKAILIACFILVTSPASAHAIAHAAYVSGKKPVGYSDRGRAK